MCCNHCFQYLVAIVAWIVLSDVFYRIFLMPPSDEYHAVCVRELPDLDGRITEYLRNGWECTGGMEVFERQTALATYQYFCQAVFRR